MRLDIGRTEGNTQLLDKLLGILLGMTIGILSAFLFGLIIIVSFALLGSGLSDNEYASLFLLYPIFGICGAIGGLLGS